MEPTTETKELALSEVHHALGGRMVPFAGYSMPLRYDSQIEEHLHVRRAVGVFDVSHMGEFFVSGPSAFALIQKLTTNDVAALYDGRVQYSCMPNGKGGIVDDLLVYRITEEKYMLVVNASNMEKDWNWIQKHNTEGAILENHSDAYSLFAVQGPKAAEALQSLTAVDLSDLKYYTFEIGTFAGVENIIISATGYTGAGGFEIYVPNEHALTVWNAIFASGKPFDIRPIGLAARDTLRLEMGFCLYGNDIDDTTSPIEAGLGWITKFKKEFTDSDFLKKQKEEGVSRKLVGFELTGKGIPRQGYAILNDQNETIGEVRSGSQSPSLGTAIGMGYVKTEYTKPGSTIFIDIRQKPVEARVVALPFYKNS